MTRLQPEDVAAWGLLPPSRPRLLRNRLENALSTALPVAGFVGATVVGDVLAWTSVTWAVFLVSLPLAIMGMGLGLHRYFSHRAFRTVPLIHGLLAFLGTAAMQGPLIRWVSDHRRHHSFTDRPGDPHSPWFAGRREIRSRWLGFVHAHYAWMFTGQLSDPGRWSRDLERDATARFVSRFYWPVALLGLLLPGAIGWVLGGPAEGVRCFAWSGCFRVMLLHQATWGLASLGHCWGRRRPENRDHSRDNAFMALLSLGEGWHAYHHRHPQSAVNEPVALDVIGLLVLALERVGLAWGVKGRPELRSPRRA